VVGSAAPAPENVRGRPGRRTVEERRRAVLELLGGKATVDQVSPRDRDESANAVPRAIDALIFTRAALSARSPSRRTRCSPTRKPAGNQGRKGNGPGDRSQGPLLKGAGSRFRDPA